jgi:hypothetical protein
MFVGNVHCLIFFSFFTVLGFEIRDSHLLGRSSTFEPHPQHFCYDFFLSKILLFPSLVLDCNPTTLVANIARIKDTYHQV